MQHMKANFNFFKHHFLPPENIYWIDADNQPIVKKHQLKGLSREIELAFEDMHGQF
jgi:hypothetical protein